jgi:transposase InsO family protein
MTIDGPNQLWVADITYIAIASGFVYLAAILDAWSRRRPAGSPAPRPGAAGRGAVVAICSSNRRAPVSYPSHPVLPEVPDL